MLINALNDYYDILASAGNVTADGVSKQSITHRIMLRLDGTISAIIDIREQSEPDKKGKTKYKSIDVNLPERTQKPAIDSNIIEHRPLYIFGLNYDNKTKAFTAEDPKDKARKSHECFVKCNLAYTKEMTSEIVTAYRNFMENWVPENETENEELLTIAKEYSSAYFVFSLDGHPEIELHSADGEIMRKVTANILISGKSDGVCAITGSEAEIARIHDKIRGIRGGQSAGCSLVCVNSTAEESFGKSKAYNSSISQTAMKRYTEALNTLIANPKHHRYIEDLTVVFWAMSKDDETETDLLMSMLGFDDEKADSSETNLMIENAVKELSESRTVDLSTADIDENVMFYIAGLAPNNSRISQKFVYRDKFGKIFLNAARHQADMRIAGARGQISFGRMIFEMKSPKSKNEKVSPVILASVFTAVLNGTKYPNALLETIIRRVKTDRTVNYARAGIIKACVNRVIRANKKEEEIKVALDNNNTNQAYLCGRLFAVLEKIQQNAAGTKLNRTIKDAYFSSACSRPAVVFPQLIKLSGHHLKKDKYEHSNNKLIGEIMDKLNNQYPSTLSLQEQGKFIIGYYHQQQDFFKKNETTED